MRTIKRIAAKTDGYTNSWPQKAVNWHLKLLGLTKNRLLGKHFPKTRWPILALVFISICHQLYGILTQIAKGDFTLAQTVIPFQTTLFMIGAAEESYIFIYREDIARKCVKNSTEKLFCLSYVNETQICKKHMPLYKFLMVTFVGTVYGVVVIAILISPLFRFGLNIGSASFVLYPIWYPVDVISSRVLFWTAFVYESLIFGVVVFTYSNNNTLFLYLFMMARMRFDALGLFFREAIPDCKHLSSSFQKEIQEDNAKKSFTNQQLLNLKRPALYSTTGNIHTIPPIFSYKKLEILKKGIKDLHRLRRQAKLINNMFKIYFSVCHSAAFVSTIIFFFMMANEIRNSFGALSNASTQILMFAFMGIASLIQIYTACYVANLLQESYDDLRFSLWQSNWYTEKAEFKRLFIHTKAILNQPLTMKAYSFYPINLHSFNSSLKESWRNILFLYQLTAPKL